MVKMSEEIPYYCIVCHERHSSDDDFFNRHKKFDYKDLKATEKEIEDALSEISDSDLKDELYDIEDDETFLKSLEAKVGLPAKSVGYTYFLQCNDGGLIKIGETQEKTPKMRRDEIQSNCPENLKLITFLRGIDWETVFHNRFRRFLVHHEWFKPAEQIFKFIIYLKDREITQLRSRK